MAAGKRATIKTAAPMAILRAAKEIFLIAKEGFIFKEKSAGLKSQKRFKPKVNPKSNFKARVYSTNSAGITPERAAAEKLRKNMPADFQKCRVRESTAELKTTSASR